MKAHKIKVKLKIKIKYRKGKPEKIERTKK